MTRLAQSGVRPSRRDHAAALGFLLVPALVPLAFLLLAAPGDVGLVMVALLPTFPLLGGTTWYLLRRPERDAVLAADLLLCPRCRYDLRGRTDTTPILCPECGRSHEDADAIRSAWRSHYLTFMVSPPRSGRAD